MYPCVHVTSQGVLYDSEWIQGVQEVIKQDNIKGLFLVLLCKLIDILDLVTILPWRDEIKKHPIKSNTANKDITVVVKEGFYFQKFGPEMKQADQSMESYKWIIPVGNPRSIISQLQALNNSMKSENETNLAVPFDHHSILEPLTTQIRFTHLLLQ